MSNKLIRKAYESRLATWAAARGTPLRVQYQNQPFAPVTGETYLKAFLLPAPKTSGDLTGAHLAYTGVFQISVVAPINTGPGAAEGIADEIEAQFTLNLRLTQSTVTVQIVTPATQAPALQDASSYIVPVIFGYRADTI